MPNDVFLLSECIGRSRLCMQWALCVCKDSVGGLAKRVLISGCAGGPLGSPIYLYITLYLERCPRVLLRHLKVLRQPHVMQAALSSSVWQLSQSGMAPHGNMAIGVMRLCTCLYMPTGCRL